MIASMFFFFFQAEDGIRDGHVTGVQTCALPIANYYGPSSYGIYNVFLSYILIIPVLTTMRLDSILLLQRGAKEIRNFLSGILLFSFVVIFLIVSFFLFFNQLGWVVFLFPVSFL